MENLSNKEIFNCHISNNAPSFKNNCWINNLLKITRQGYYLIVDQIVKLFCFNVLYINFS